MSINVIPKVKKIVIFQGECDARKIKWNFAEGTDNRVINAAYRISESSAGTPVYISHNNEDGEGYTLNISENEIKIEAENAAGAFYAISTLKMLIKSSEGKIECCNITDSPDMPYRGFYQDTTRGRIPTLNTLKKLVDTMADYKMNSLQLYVEHSYDFKEYEHCKDKLGYLTKAEIQELDLYCKERFIELIPSLSTFGHLYHLLQSDKYKHLCELKDYEPTAHHFKERMKHHTINPILDESFELIKSLIDQHMDAFTSDKFNICCDETFDLGTDVNKDKDKGDIYIGFVKKLIAYLESKDKTVMMWGDIVLQHSDKIAELSDNLVFLNWAYEQEPEEEKFAALKDKVQIVCPGTSSWEGFNERVQKETDNILNLTKYGVKYGAKGILNTNWGDIGNPASIDMAMYGLILGACAGWDTKTQATVDFKQFISKYYYGCIEAVSILEQLGDISPYACWLTYNWEHLGYEDGSQEAFEKAMMNCDKIIEKIEKSDFKDEEIKKEFLIASQGNSLLIEWSARKMGYTVKSSVDFKSWIKDYEENWFEDSKQSELNEVVKIFTELNDGIIFK